jgi:addiction module RelE/StbE family toxin
MEARFERAFMKAMKKHASIKKLVQRKVDLIMENPLGVGEPLKGNWRGFYSCLVKRNFIIIYLFCEACRKKGDDTIVLCSGCDTTPDGTVKFVLLGPHDQAYAS